MTAAAGGDAQASRFRKPPAAPTAADLDDRDRFNDLVTKSLPDVQASAEKWRTGLASLVTLVTGGLLIKGPESAADLTTMSRLALTVLAGGGLVFAVLGLWRALQASAGVPQTQQLRGVLAKHGSVSAFQVSQAREAAAKLRKARHSLLVGLVLLGLAVFVWWWADKAPASPPALVQVDTASSKVCGRLKSADGQVFRILVDGQAKEADIEFSEATNVRVVAKC
jgi:hypothetical protein